MASTTRERLLEPFKSPTLLAGIVVGTAVGVAGYPLFGACIGIAAGSVGALVDQEDT